MQYYFNALIDYLRIIKNENVKTYVIIANYILSSAFMNLFNLYLPLVIILIQPFAFQKISTFFLGYLVIYSINSYLEERFFINRQWIRLKLFLEKITRKYLSLNYDEIIKDQFKKKLYTINEKAIDDNNACTESIIYELVLIL